MKGDSVTFSCPLQFIESEDISLGYEVSWDTSEQSNIVEHSKVGNPGVVFNNRTLELTVLDVTEPESYTCRITSANYGSINFDATIASDPVRILLLGQFWVLGRVHPVIQSGSYC